MEERFFLQVEFIGKVYFYEGMAKQERLNWDFSKYKSVIKQYLKDGLLKQKIGLKNKLKVIVVLYFTKQYLKFKLREQ